MSKMSKSRMTAVEISRLPPAAFLRETTNTQGSEAGDKSHLHQLSPDHPTAATFPRKARSVRTPEIRFAARAVTQWLNGERHGAYAVEGSWEYHTWRNTPHSRKRIIALREVISEQLKNLQELVADFPDVLKADPSSIALTIPLPRVHTLMEAYPTAPALQYDLASGCLGIRQWPTGSRYPTGEVLAAHGLISLAQAEALDLLRICKCDRWYFAGRTDSPGCSPKCRQKLYDQTDEAKEKRRVRLQKNRAYKRRSLHPGAASPRPA